MKTIVCALAVCVGGVALAGRAEAGPGHGHAPRPTYARHGVKFSGGHYYPGHAHAHNHWRYRVYNSHYRRYHYWDAHRRCYYYYCPTRLGYYPVVATPTCAAGFGNVYATQFNY